jgi:hypothetical protein
MRHIKKFKQFLNENLNEKLITHSTTELNGYGEPFPSYPSPPFADLGEFVTDIPKSVIKRKGKSTFVTNKWGEIIELYRNWDNDWGIILIKRHAKGIQNAINPLYTISTPKKRDAIRWAYNMKTIYQHTSGPALNRKVMYYPDENSLSGGTKNVHHLLPFNHKKYTT